jgi:hypothetical protein
MTPVTASVHEALAQVDAAWNGTDDPTALADTDLIEVNRRLGTLRRLAEGVHARVAAEIDRRSRPDLGKAGLARQAGFRSPAKLIAATTGAHNGDASRLIDVGRAVEPRTALTGEAERARHPFIAEALRTGALSVAAAAAITRMLDKLPPRVAEATRQAAEEALAQQAPGLSLDELQGVLQRAQASLDPLGLETKIADLRAARHLRITEDASGATVLSARLDPETAAPIVTAISAIVTHQLRTSRGANRPSPDPGAAGVGARGLLNGHDPIGEPAGGRLPSGNVTSDGILGGDVAIHAAMGVETRTLAQMNADALATLARHALGCDSAVVPGSSARVVVRMTLDDLRPETVGLATIDGAEQPIDAGTARRLAASADLIPAVLGTRSEVLDLGRSARAFTHAQNLVLSERDGGCANCHLPPAFCEAHHLDYWSRGGPTDLDNGVLLCTSCHHRVHDDGWQIRVDRPPGAPPAAGRVWFIPPEHVDPARRPRAGGRHRYDPLVRAPFDSRAGSHAPRPASVGASRVAP